MAREVTYQPGLVDYINMGGGVVLSSFKVMEEAVSVPFFDVEKIKAFAQSNKLKWAGRTLLGMEMCQAGKRVYDYYKDHASFSTEQVAHDWLTLGSNAVGLFLGAVTLKNPAYELALNISKVFDVIDFAALFENLMSDANDGNISGASLYYLAGLAARVGVKSFIKRPPATKPQSISVISHSEEGFTFELTGVPTVVTKTTKSGCFRFTKINLPGVRVNIDGVRSVSIHNATASKMPCGLTVGTSSLAHPDGSPQLSLHGKINYQKWVKEPGDAEFRLEGEVTYKSGDIEILDRLYLNRNTSPNGPWFLNAETGARGRVTLVREDGTHHTIFGSLHLDLGVHPEHGPYVVLSQRVDNTPAKAKRKK